MWSYISHYHELCVSKYVTFTALAQHTLRCCRGPNTSWMMWNVHELKDGQYHTFASENSGSQCKGTPQHKHAHI